jgi:hypothetical protein
MPPKGLAIRQKEDGALPDAVSSTNTATEKPATALTKSDDSKLHHESHYGAYRPAEPAPPHQKRRRANPRSLYLMILTIGNIAQIKRQNAKRKKRRRNLWRSMQSWQLKKPTQLKKPRQGTTKSTQTIAHIAKPPWRERAKLQTPARRRRPGNGMTFRDIRTRENIFGPPLTLFGPPQKIR